MEQDNILDLNRVKRYRYPSRKKIASTPVIGRIIRLKQIVGKSRLKSITRLKHSR